ncbi:MAG: transpeptidase family protein [Acidobacteriota bacterium]|nr:transpeptidase family protein [Acidobacteriota bacterium]
MDTPSEKRVIWVARIALIWAILILGRLFQLQILRHDDFLRQALQQQEKLVEIQAPRGTILDRAGQKLALSLPVDSVCINPLRVKDLGVASDILGRILNVDRPALLDKMKAAAAARRGFLWVKRRITPEESARLRDLQPKPDWIELRPESRRFYPNKTLAAHLIGGVDFEEKGNAGIEQSLNEQLEGHPGAIRVTSDVKQRGFESQVATEPQAGRPLRLTIDSRIQFIAERELKNAVETHHCKTGSLVAINPRTGEILALANYPTYDPNEPPTPGEEVEARMNLAVTAPFEPGSVFKVITLSAALETTRLRPESVIPCGNGSLSLFGRVVHDHNSYSALPMEDVLARSSNIGAINVGLKVGDANMYDYIKRFGFGKTTGIALPGESAGIVRPLKRWQRSSIGSVAMGHEVSATTLQLAQAASIIANGGVLVKPHLLADAPADPPRRVLKPETAITMRQMMEGVILKTYGTGHKYARIPGYTAGGKTGTAQIYDLKTHQYTHYYNASFMGFAPVTNPAIVVVVTINGATGLAGYGGPSSGPVFREVAAAALRLMDVPKDQPDLPLSPEEAVDADDNDLAIAEIADSETAVLAAAKPSPDQNFLAAALPANFDLQLAGPKVPNFLGLTVRAAVETSSSRGIPVEFMGSGLARAQFPPPGSILPLGERVRIQFGR